MTGITLKVKPLSNKSIAYTIKESSSKPTANNSLSELKSKQSGYPL